ncbi:MULTISPECIES: serine/threonine-protein kinase [Clostridium]|uniref:non-specific serine/threonine protein kinase n=1 Tax=Clostridium frigoriphilum TaxID=443253 RepID=A0ABU7USN9_9CLOT|nr:serine/threonine-protein kinase [Clostridium sp. DSM 17811]MBU3101262.1 protein kinase [Clostridium sp. DSM 17811]
MELIGKIFENKYQILDVLGKGGMSTVYLAKDIKLQKLWAIKEVSVSTINSKSNLMAETNILKKLDHPALPRIVDIITIDDSIYLVLDYIDGISLDIQLQEVGMFEEKTVIDWAKQICDVLDYLHCIKPNPIIYRDMKPGNLMLTSLGKIKLIDFGIAREYKEEVSTDTTCIGTKGYAASEQYGSHQTDARTDIYSLGVTLYHLATGKGPNDPPYEIKPAREMNPLLSEGFEYIISKCTKQDPILRYQNVKEVIFDLENIHKLNSSYRELVRKKMLKVYIILFSFVLSSVFIFSGNCGIQRENIKEYNSIIKTGEELKADKKYDEAITTFDIAVEKNTNRPEAYIDIANSYLEDTSLEENQRLEKGISYLIDNVILKKISVAKDERILSLMGNTFFKEKNYKEAYKYYGMIENPKDKSVIFYKDTAQTLGYDQKSSKEIITIISNLENYIKTMPDTDMRIRSYMDLTDIYTSNQDIYPNSFDKVIKLLEQANSLGKATGNAAGDYKLYVRLGKAYNDKAGNLKEGTAKYIASMKKSLEYYNLALNNGFNKVDGYYSIGNAYEKIGSYVNSEKTFEKMINMFPNDYVGYTQLGLLYYNIEVHSPTTKKTYTKVNVYYKLALKRYDRSINDDQFGLLEDHIKELKAQKSIK